MDGILYVCKTLKWLAIHETLYPSLIGRGSSAGRLHVQQRKSVSWHIVSILFWKACRHTIFCFFLSGASKMVAAMGIHVGPEIQGEGSIRQGKQQES